MLGRYSTDTFDSVSDLLAYTFADSDHFAGAGKMIVRFIP